MQCEIRNTHATALRCGERNWASSVTSLYFFASSHDNMRLEPRRAIAVSKVRARRLVATPAHLSSPANPQSNGHTTPPPIVARALRLPQDGVSRLREVFPKSFETHLIDARVARVQIETMCWSGLPRRVIGVLVTLLAPRGPVRGSLSPPKLVRRLTTNTQRAPNNQKPRAYAMVRQTRTKSKTQKSAPTASLSRHADG